MVDDSREQEFLAWVNASFHRCYATDCIALDVRDDSWDSEQGYLRDWYILITRREDGSIQSSMLRWGWAGKPIRLYDGEEIVLGPCDLEEAARKWWKKGYSEPPRIKHDV